MIEETATIAGTILLAGSAILALLIKARKVWSRDSRDIEYDAGQTQWVRDLQIEVSTLRKDKEILFAQRIEDVRRIAELQASDAYLKRQVSELLKKLDVMEISMRRMRAQLVELNPHVEITDFNKLDA